MKKKVLEIINVVRQGKNLSPLVTLAENATLREDVGLSSFDLAELTVRIEEAFGVDIFENGIVNTIGEIYKKIEE